MRPLRLHTAVVLLALGALFGCSDDDTPPASASSSGAPNTPPSPTVPSPSNGDGGRLEDGGGNDGDGCGVAEHASADEIEEVALDGEAPPPLGGEIVPGRYVLSEMNAYVPEDPDAGPPTGPGASVTDVVGRGTIIIDATKMRVLRSRKSKNDGAPASEQGSFTYKVEGTSLRRTKTCPGQPVDDTVPFTATGSGLALFVDAQHREVYVRIE